MVGADSQVFAAITCRLIDITEVNIFMNGNQADGDLFTYFRL